MPIINIDQLSIINNDKVSDMQPPSSETPLIGTYFSCIMIMVGFFHLSRYDHMVIMVGLFKIMTAIMVTLQ